MSDFASDVTCEILSRVPVKSILRFKCVSKHWCALIDNMDFIKLHLDRSNATKTNRNLILNSKDSSVYSLNFDSLNVAEELDHPLGHDVLGTGILGSCNGLFVLYTKSKKDLVLWNPSTRKHHKLPRTEMDWLIEFDPECPPGYGFGYDSVNHDYKVVKILHGEVEVYSLESNSWHTAMNLQYYLFDTKEKYGDALHGILFNGALYWLALNDKGPRCELTLIAFDLATENTQIVPLPRLGDDDFRTELAVLEGRFCILAYYLGGRLDVWAMKDYGMKKSWNKLFSTIKLRLRCLRPLVYSKDGRKVLLQHERRRLVWFDIEANVAKEIEVRGLPERKFESEICLQSLVPVGGGDGKPERKRQRKHK